MTSDKERVYWIRYDSVQIQDRAIVTMEGEYETAPKLSNDTSLNDLE